ncbi:hypothetical protein KUTeg_015032 [Tegillarca granosa]|uniref:Uncharacterized protein n=1 Tax=Tegillarca granosa TaxID=220873 RepID=A0ABQ9ENY4_TEGGR|nr:hypothetical protein KUTeg_015032 [Tegillarca granosa]
MEPYEEEREISTIDEIIQKVKTSSSPPFRPKIPSTIDNSSSVMAIINIMQECWNEDNNVRPSFPSIKKKLSDVTGISASHNFLDALLRRMEQYANNLEDLVEERTQAFLDEKRKSEELLYEILPRQG